jgi:hypothetical protein
MDAYLDTDWKSRLKFDGESLPRRSVGRRRILLQPAKTGFFCIRYSNAHIIITHFTVTELFWHRYLFQVPAAKSKPEFEINRL